MTREIKRKTGRKCGTNTNLVFAQGENIVRFAILILFLFSLFNLQEANAHDSNLGMDMLNGCDNTFWSVYSAGVFPLYREYGGYRLPRVHYDWYRGYNPTPYNWFKGYYPMRIYRYKPKYYHRPKRRPLWHFGNGMTPTNKNN